MTFDYHYLLFLIPACGLAWTIYAIVTAPTIDIEEDNYPYNQSFENDGAYAEDED